MPSSDISDSPNKASAMPHSTLQPASAIWRSVEQARAMRPLRVTPSASVTGSLLPDEEKRLTQLFQEIEAIISEMDPRTPGDIRKQIEKHGIIPRVRHSIDMSVAEWRSSMNNDNRGVHFPPQGYNDAVFIIPPDEYYVDDQKANKKTKPLDVRRSPGDTGKKTGKAESKKGKISPEPAPAVPEESRLNLFGKSLPPTPDSLSLNSQASRFKPLPSLPPEAKAIRNDSSKGNAGHPFKYSELLKRVISLAPYLSDRSRKALTIIAQEIDWWDDQFEQEFGHRCEAVHLPGYPLSSEDVRAYYDKLAEDSDRARPPSITPPRSVLGHAEMPVGKRRREGVEQPVFRPEENTTLKKANEARELQRAASLGGRGSPLRRRAEGVGVGRGIEILILDLPRCIHQPLHFKSALIIIALAAGVATGPCRGGTLISAQASVKLPINSGFEVSTCRVPRGFPESGGFNDEPTSYVPLKGLGYHTQLLPSPPEVGRYPMGMRLVPRDAVLGRQRTWASIRLDDSSISIVCRHGQMYTCTICLALALWIRVTIVDGHCLDPFQLIRTASFALAGILAECR
ncbi:hypothetical protein FA13DRAFT_1777620 [Coprinellus micaceus]|uniref:Uncharacterized protein n=1 Tax=Coprinellus micaceus TaxID=71717 RepID=A0A4Y7SSY3_COPMI|nr:hypothetical protein FA13DRAFT_1777620 [Coprinellus micaceus]